MKMKINKYNEFILYTVFGVGTTVVNFAVYWAMLKIMGDGMYLVANVFAWLASVIYAFITNKLYVFKSTAKDMPTVLKEVAQFAGARLISLVFEEVGLLVLLGAANLSEYTLHLGSFSIDGTMLIKLILAVFVVMSNYFFSKFIIFRKR
jgi:putative flippase GtrA